MRELDELDDKQRVASEKVYGTLLQSCAPIKRAGDRAWGISLRPSGEAALIS